MDHASFDETLALEDQTFLGPLADDDCALYEEYVRGFDDVPTLLDPVLLPPPRAVPPEFRFGERKDFRRYAREDAESLRESSARKIEELYREYAEPTAAKPKAGQSKKSRRRRKNKK